MSRISAGFSLLTIGLLFFIFGFVTWLNGALIPFLKLVCELTYSQALLVTFAFYISYVLLAFPASAILNRIGFKHGMAVGLWVMALGALVFIPAAWLRSYGLFLAGLFIQGAGLALLQTAVNPYVINLGPADRAAQRISVMGVCNKVAGVLSPLIAGGLILQNSASIQAQLAKSLTPDSRLALLTRLAERVIIPYAGMAGLLVLLGLGVVYSSLPAYKQQEAPQPTTATIWSFPGLVLGALALFFYVGVEVIAGDTITPYGVALGIPLEVAKNFTSMTLGAMLLGYSVGIVAIPRYITQQQALRLCALSGLLFSMGILATSGFISVMFVALLGVSNALIWPSIFPIALQGLGRLTQQGSALLVMGIGGGAILPQCYGQLVNWLGEQQAYGLLIPCYGIILLYAYLPRTIGRR